MSAELEIIERIIDVCDRPGGWPPTDPIVAARVASIRAYAVSLREGINGLDRRVAKLEDALSDKFVVATCHTDDVVNY